MSDFTKAAAQLHKLAETLFLNENKKFTAATLSPRLTATADRLRYDLTINQVAFVVAKMAEKEPHREVTSQDLKYLANKFYNPNTKFASEFADLLDEETQVAAKHTDRIDYQGDVKDLAMDGAYEKQASNIYDEAADNSSLVDSSVPITGEDLELARHAAMLISDEFKTTGKVNKVSSILKHKTAEMFLFQTTIRTASNELETIVFVPVEIKNDTPLFPQVMSTTEKVYTLDSVGVDNLTADIEYTTQLKKSSHSTSLRTAADYDVALRSDSMGKFSEEVDELDVEAPTQISLGHDEIERVLKQAVLSKESKFNKQAQEEGRQLVDMELKDLGFSHSQVTFDGDYAIGLTYNASVNTEVGKFKINIAVENRKGTLLPPYQFVADNQVHEFSKQNITAAARSSKGVNTIDEEAHPLLFAMSYPDLMKQLKSAAADRKHKTAQQIISLIDEKFGEHYRNNATDDYQTWLEQSLTSYASRCGDCNYYAPKTAQANSDYCSLIKTAAKNVGRDLETDICTRSTYAGADEKVFFDAGNDIKVTWED
jgi:hypothetical protein